MIVRDEGQVIERCLDSVRDLIDSWVICDTGSRDDTVARIERSLATIPGELHHRTWVDFAHNRTECIALARSKADYLLLLDADITVEAAPGCLDHLTADAYLVRLAGDPEYWMPYVVRADLPWRYVTPIHEYIICDEPTTSDRLPGLVMTHHADGGARSGKFERDLEVLTGLLEAEPDNPRASFYLAQTHRDLGNRDLAVELYRRRIDAGGWDEEVFFAAYQVGVLLAEDGDERSIAALLDAWNRRPTRAEPLLHLARAFRQREQWPSAYLFAGLGVEIPRPDDILFVESWVYDWGLLFELSIAAHWRGHYDDAIDAGERLLARDLPADVRDQAEKNLAFSVAAREGVLGATEVS